MFAFQLGMNHKPRHDAPHSLHPVAEIGQHISMLLNQIVIADMRLAAIQNGDGNMRLKERNLSLANHP
jgi:hypothetical protein